MSLCLPWTGKEPPSTEPALHASSVASWRAGVQPEGSDLTPHRTAQGPSCPRHPPHASWSAGVRGAQNVPVRPQPETAVAGRGGGVTALQPGPAQQAVAVGFSVPE